MKTKTIREIAVWLKDRIDAGQHEENGSYDMPYTLYIPHISED